jgi:hypothetical protein
MGHEGCLSQASGDCDTGFGTTGQQDGSRSGEVASAEEES